MSKPARSNQYAVSIPLHEVAAWVVQHRQIVLDPPNGRGAAVLRPFPPETQLARGYYDPAIDCLVLVYAHPTFPPTEAGWPVLRVRTVDRGDE